MIPVAGDKYRKLLKEETNDPNIVWRHGGPPVFDVVNKLFEQTRTKDFRTIDPRKFQLIVNGREGLSGEETLRQGSYNALLKNTLPEQFRYYKTEDETFETSHDTFRSAFPRGFAWEVTNVYSGPPVITFKFRHWGFFEGPFKGHAPTGEMVQFYGIGVMKVDESMRAEEVEIYYDPAELFAGLLKGTPMNGTDGSKLQAQSCPFSNRR
ncbi:Pathogen-related protein [Linum perenne]